jgi:transcriptional regulator of acetoin/glycerol metabolism
MPSQWLALEPTVDPRVRARQLRQSWERLLADRELKSESGPELTGGLRRPIVESWKRSLDSGLDAVDLLAPVEADPGEVQERWAEHPLGSLTHMLDQLKDIAGESQSLIVVSDASGLLLHIDGPDWLKARAADMNFVEGARYSETAAGTNGIGTVLAADHALQVFAFEHFNQLHPWVDLLGGTRARPRIGSSPRSRRSVEPVGGGPPAQPGARDHSCPGAGAVPCRCPARP